MVVVAHLDLTHVEDPLGLGIQGVDIALGCSQTCHQSGEELTAADRALHLAVTGDGDIVLVDFLNRIRRSRSRCRELNLSCFPRLPGILFPGLTALLPEFLPFLLPQLSLPGIGQCPEHKDYQQYYEFDGQSAQDTVDCTLIQPVIQ